MPTAGSSRRRGDAGELRRARRASAPRCSPSAARVALVLYFCWLLQPDRVGNPVLFGVLIAAELFNVVQALGFWWTCLPAPAPAPAGRARRRLAGSPVVDVLHPDLQRAGRRSSSRPSPRRRGCAAPRSASPCSTTATARRWSSWPRRHGVALRAPHAARRRQGRQHQPRPRAHRRAVRRSCSTATTCPHPTLLERTLPEFADRSRGVTCRRRSTTPTHDASRVAAAAWSQQALFFGPIARGKDAHGSMFCCGTNVVFRRTRARGGRRLPGGLAHRGLRAVDRPARARLASVYVPEVLRQRPRAGGPGVLRQPAAPLGPRLHRRDPARAPVAAAAAARSCSTCCRRRTSCPGGPCSCTCRCPVIRILTGAQPIAGAAADSFLAALRAVLRAVAGRRWPASAPGTYTFAAYSLATSTFWIHVHATYTAVLRRARDASS